MDGESEFLCLGIRKQTNWQRSTCDPKWDEVKDLHRRNLSLIVDLDTRFSFEWSSYSKYRYA